LERPVKRFIPLLTLLAIAGLPLRAVEIKKDGWLFPQPARAEKKAIRTIDTTERIPGRETLMKVYKKDENVVFETLEIEGELFACQFHVKGKDGAPATAYAIVDTDGDGVFESKYPTGEHAPTPDWVIERYYKKHTEAKDPGPSADTHPR
jgi:hypothetical protein